jgi:hypothetical protein
LLQLGEVGKIEVFLDTRRFVGPKTCALYVDIGTEERKVIRFTVNADSRDPPQP